MFNREKFFEHYMSTFISQGNRLTQVQVYAFLYHAHKHHFLYHLDDDPATIRITEQGNLRGNLFTAREVEILNTIVPAFYGLPDYDNDPHRICMELMNPMKHYIIITQFDEHNECCRVQADDYDHALEQFEDIATEHNASQYIIAVICSANELGLNELSDIILNARV